MPFDPATLVVLRRAGHVLGLCGNWVVVTATVPRWHRLFSFIGPMEMSKASFLAQVKRHCAADDYVMIGNDPLVFGQSPDREAAEQAGWRFLREAEFAAGAR